MPGDDQKRITTPFKAIREGADYLVVGRPIRQAEDPVAAARQVVEEIAAPGHGRTAAEPAAGQAMKKFVITYLN